MPPSFSGPYPSTLALESSFRELLLGAGASARTIGTSSQGRPLVAYTRGSRGPVLWLTALMHGTEVIGALALLRWLQEGLPRGVFEGFRLTVVPVVNPDAFHENMAALARGGAAFQRCNGRGVDLNRNFEWLGSVDHPMGGSSRRWSPHYRGEQPFSEPETRALQALAAQAPPALSLAFHSFGEVLLFPWSYRKNRHPDTGSYERLGAAMNRGMRGLRYEVKPGAAWYPIAGDMDDFLDHRHGTLAMTVEVGRLDRRLLDPWRLLNPFWWMNPLDIEGAVGALPAGLDALLNEARPLLSERERRQRQALEEQVRGEVRGEVRVVEGGAHLDDIHAHQAAPRQPAE